MTTLLSLLEQSFLLMPLILGLYITYSVLKITDISVDGTYVLGAAITARLITLWALNPVIVILVSMLAGALIGCIIAYIQRGDRIDPLIVGIIAVFMLYSVNLQIMDKPNISLLGSVTIKDCFSPLVISLTVTITIVLALGLLLNSKHGLLLRVFGENKHLINKVNKNPEFYRMVGLALSNGLAALCGSLCSQVYTYADINMGFGMALTGISAVIIGIHLMLYLMRSNKNLVLAQIAGCLLGGVIYFAMVNFLLKIGIDSINLKFALGLMLIVFMRTYGR